MIETTSDYFRERAYFLEEERTRLEVELFEARFDADMQRAMIKQLHTFWLTLTISTTVFALLLTAVVMLVRG